MSDRMNSAVPGGIVDRAAYLARREQQGRRAEPRVRTVCPVCRKAANTCYCAHIRSFNAGPTFVILIHPKENRKRVGTGRLCHLCIRNSELIAGIDFSGDARVREILADPTKWPVVLYPGPNATDIGEAGGATLAASVPAGRQLVIFVIDGSWACARKMLRLSANLRALPQIRFNPPSRSIYQIRRQPKDLCLSSLEAMHFVIEYLNGTARWRSEPGHENLLEVFRLMIAQQLAFVVHPDQKATRGIR